MSAKCKHLLFLTDYFARSRSEISEHPTTQGSKQSMGEETI